MREKWPQRTFPTDMPAGRFPYLIERLRGTPARIEEKVRDIPNSALVRRVDGTWSSQENIGHLGDLEDLHLGRLDDLEASVDVLRAADMDNKRTWKAEHNTKPLRQLL